MAENTEKGGIITQELNKIAILQKVWNRWNKELNSVFNDLKKQRGTRPNSPNSSLN